MAVQVAGSECKYCWVCERKFHQTTDVLNYQWQDKGKEHKEDHLFHLDCALKILAKSPVRCRRRNRFFSTKEFLIPDRNKLWKKYMVGCARLESAAGIENVMQVQTPFSVRIAVSKKIASFSNRELVSAVCLRLLGTASVPTIPVEDLGAMIIGAASQCNVSLLEFLLPKGPLSSEGLEMALHNVITSGQNGESIPRTLALFQQFPNESRNVYREVLKCACERGHLLLIDSLLFQEKIPNYCREEALFATLQSGLSSEMIFGIVGRIVNKGPIDEQVRQEAIRIASQKNLWWVEQLLVAAPGVEWSELRWPPVFSESESVSAAYEHEGDVVMEQAFSLESSP